MKNSNLIAGLALIITLFGALTQCKKGEDDPFISLRSRKARVVGEWAATSGTAKITDKSLNFSSTSTYNYSNSSYSSVSIETFMNTTTTNSRAGVFSYKISFASDGTFAMTRIEDTEISTVKGTWNFSDGVGETKKKEQIILFVTSETFQASSTIAYVNTSTGNQPSKVYSIKELRNKKMVLFEESSVISSTGGSEEIKEEFTFEQ